MGCLSREHHAIKTKNAINSPNHKRQKAQMLIDCISDLHGYYPQLKGGDLLIIAGDLTAHDTEREHLDFILWLEEQNYTKKVYIAGNHDTCYAAFTNLRTSSCQYICDSGTEFEGLKIWGSPWTKAFLGMNPKCKAFTLDTEEQLAEKWALIPNDTDILITHCPPHGILDEVQKYSVQDRKMIPKNFGSRSLKQRLLDIKPKLHVFGHIHECGGNVYDTGITKCVNSSYVNEVFDAVNDPIRIIL